jgi:hypothetical protein
LFERAAGAFILYFTKVGFEEEIHFLITLSRKMALARQKGGFKKNQKSLPA